MRRGLLVAISIIAFTGCAGVSPEPTASNGKPSISPSSDAGSTASAEPRTVPTPTASSAASRQPSAVAFWDALDGVVGVTISSPDGSNATGELLRTSDGGRTWANARPADGRIEQVAVAGLSDVWAVVGCPSDGPGSCTNLLRSTDGGATWTDTGTTGATRVSFVDAERGWAVFPGTDPSTGAFRRTTDGGSTWSAAPDPCTASKVGGLGDVAFASRSVGLAVCTGEPGAGSQLKTVTATDDGGASWRIRASTGDFTGTSGDGRTGSIPVGGYVGPYGDVVVAHDGTAWMTGGRMVPLSSTDAGATWLPLGLGDTDVNLVESAWPLDRENGFALIWEPDRQATILESTADGGRTWTELAAWPVAG